MTTLFLHFFLFLTTTCVTNLIPGVHSHCIEDQQLSLLHFKKSLVFDSSESSKLITWNSSTDCCSWLGVNCSTLGHVVGLDLSSESITCSIDNSSNLFQLQHLQSLNLSKNTFNGPQIPSAIGNLTKLANLDLSRNKFNGPISAIHWESLVNLESLDLSHNLLNGSIPSSIFSSPLLEKLSLSYNQFSGQVLEFSNTSSYLLETLDLGNNNLEGQIPTSIFNLKGLLYLHLSSNNFSGFPFHGPQQPRNLSSLDLSHNSLFDYNGTDSSFLQIQNLLLSSNKLRAFPNFLKNQFTLWELDLSKNQIQGQIPNWIWSLNSLERLNLSCNSLDSLQAPRLNSTSTLSSLDLHSNKIQGIDSSFSFLQLRYLALASNKLRTFPDFFRNQSSLNYLDLSNNQIQGQIPNWIWRFKSLHDLDLSYNSLSTLEAPLPNSISTLSSLDLHSNKIQGIDSSFSFLQLRYLALASNKLRTFPDFFRNQSSLNYLDLSNNQIQGQIPNWIWSLNALETLNLSCNSLESLEDPLHNSTTAKWSLDLHSNQLQGQIPMFVSGAYLDYSRNNFSSSIPTDIGDFISATTYLSLSSNNLHGAIPKSICKAIDMVLDLSNNSLSGFIPQCLTGLHSLSVLDLSRNNLTGTIPDNFPEYCRLQTLDLNRNQIQGQFPKSLVNCSGLEVLNLGNNQITDTYPCLMMSTSNLRVLVLRLNKFYGTIGCPTTNDTWPVLQIIDLAHNSLSGEIPGRMSLTWQAMVANEDRSSTNLGFNAQTAYAKAEMSASSGNAITSVGSVHNAITSVITTVYYRNTIRAIIKGLESDFKKILTIFTLIDFSFNNFNGSIPEEMGQLESLYFLNLSGNALSGEIPSSFGNMRTLESLDLSQNHLSGQIPTQFATLTFLSFFNVSNNQLTGMIPTSTQFSTFPKTCFEGNKGLWGPPLTVGTVPPPTSSNPNSGDEIDWDIISVEIGFTCGFGIAVGSLMFCKRWRKWYYRTMCKILFKIFPQLEQRFGNHRRHVYVNTRWWH